MAKKEKIISGTACWAHLKAPAASVSIPILRVEVTLGDIVCEAGGILNHAYFPDGAALSLLTVLENGTAIETANIGREGAFGLFAAMYSRSSFNRSLVQLEGGLLRVPIKVLQSEFERSAHIRNLFVRYSETLLAQIQQTVACNALHSTRQKMCRWLLMMHDRADGEHLTYTHEFLAQVLGVNRKSVTLAAQALQREGLIDYHRGLMQFSIVPASKRLRASATLLSRSASTTSCRRLLMRFKRFGMGGNNMGHGTFSLRLKG